MIAGTNFDYYHLPSNSYSIILALYPDSGNSCIIPTGAGRTASNSAFNDKGLIYILAAAPQKGPGDNGPGITGFLELPYVAMTCDTVPEAENFLINSTRMFGLNHLLLDAGGNATVLEATRARYALRRAGDNNESDYLVVTNHYLQSRHEALSTDLGSTKVLSFQLLSIHHCREDDHRPAGQIQLFDGR